jgi:N4-gp56 family major capsid protein
MAELWLLNGAEGYWYSLNLSKVLRHALQPLVKYRQFCDAKDATQQGLHKGNIYHWNVYSNLSTSNTDGELLETEEMPEGDFQITQGSLTITEYGQSVPYSGKLDDLSFHPIREIINTVLSNDAKKKLDMAAYRQFKRTPLVVAPTGGNSMSSVTLSTTGATAITNNVEMGKDHVKVIRDLMVERNIPPYQGDDHMCVAHPTTLRKLKNDLEDIRKYSDQGFQVIFSGEVGRYEKTRFVEQTNIGKENWTNGKSNQAHFFGNDTVAEAIAVPEEMRAKIPTDYGRSKGIAWYYLGGFGLVHARNDADSSANARIVEWGSAA